jgi:predicted kinase
MKKVSDVYLICGFLGAGKTVCSKRLAQDIGAVLLNPDEFCMQNYTPGEYENNWDFCFAQTMDILWQKVAACVKQGKDVVFDVGFWSKSSRVEAINRVKKMGANPLIYYIYAPDEVLKQRLKKRTGKIAEHNLLCFEEIKKSFEEPSPDEAFVTIKNY